MEALRFFIGAVTAVVCEGDGPPSDAMEEVTEFRSGRELWDWCLADNPIARMLAAELSETQRQTVRQILDGMLRERLA